MSFIAAWLTAVLAFVQFVLTIGTGVRIYRTKRARKAHGSHYYPYWQLICTLAMLIVLGTTTTTTMAYIMFRDGPENGWMAYTLWAFGGVWLLMALVLSFCNDELNTSLGGFIAALIFAAAGFDAYAQVKIDTDMALIANVLAVGAVLITIMYVGHKARTLITLGKKYFEPLPR